MREADQVEQAPARLELDQDVHVARRTGIAAGHRAEYADVAGTVLGRNALDVRPPPADLLQVDDHRIHP